MKWLAAVLVVLALVALAVGCEEEEKEAGTATPSPGATATATPDRTPSADATPTPEATPTPFAAQGLQSICLEVHQSYPDIEEEFSLPIAETLQRILAGPGVQVVAEGTPCDATFTVALTGEPVGASYGEPGGPSRFCYTGAKVDGEVTLTVPGRAPLTVPIGGEDLIATYVSITSCPSETLAPFDEVWPKAVFDGLAGLWLASLWPPLQVFAQGLEDEVSSVREAAAGALGKVGPEEGVVPALIRTLEDDEDEYVRGAAAWALGDIGPEEGVVPALIRALEEDEKSWVRRSAAWGLEKIGPEAVDAVPALIQTLGVEDEYERWDAAKALEAIAEQDLGEDADRWRQWWEAQQ